MANLRRRCKFESPLIKYGTMKSEYLEECLHKRLKPFIRKFHSKNKVLFWQNSATIHCSKSVQNWSKSDSINLVLKYKNPPNFPHTRPFELFCALCKQEYRRLSEKHKDFQSFKKLGVNK